jgi:protein involved in polysaccharide export with SLBB domain
VASTVPGAASRVVVVVAGTVVDVEGVVVVWPEVDEVDVAGAGTPVVVGAGDVVEVRVVEAASLEVLPQAAATSRMPSSIGSRADLVT